MSTLQPVPQPGLAVFPDLLSPKPLSITMASSGMSQDCTFTDNTSSATLFTLDAKSFSAHHKKTLLNASAQPILLISKKTSLTSYSYIATAPSPTSGAQVELFRTEKQFRTNTLTFTNVTNNQPVQLSVKSSSMLGYHGDIINMATGQVVGKIDKENWKWRHQYQLTVAPGMDPAIVCALAVIEMDIRATKSSTAGAAGGAAGGGGGG